MGENINCSGCEWKGDQCMKSDDILGFDIMCPVNCFLPYPKEYFNTEPSEPSLKLNLNSYQGYDPAMEEAQKFIEFHTNPNNVNQSASDVEKDEVFRCGDTYLNKGDPLPEIPDKEMLYSLLSDNRTSAYSKGDILWEKIYPSDLLYKIINLSSDQLSLQNNFQGLIDIEGVKLEWYVDNIIDKGDFYDIIGEDIDINKYVDELPEYSKSTNKFKTVIFNPKIRTVIENILENNNLSDSDKRTLNALLRNIDNENLIPEPATEKRLSYEDKITELKNQRIKEASENISIDYNITKLVHFFTVTEKDNNDKILANDFNRLLNTNENDEDYINRIKEYTTFEDLGRNFEDLKYVERKIRKFLGLNTEVLVDLFTNISHTSICGLGFSEKPMRILLNLLELSHSDEISNADLMYRKRALKIIYKYVPNLIKKVLDLSKRIEYIKCERITNKTEVYFEMYNDLFIESNALKFSLPDLGISDFFEDFTESIHRKVILLIFISFLIICVIYLFKN